MPKSPSLDIINNNFLNIKNKLDKKKNLLTFLFIFIYMFTTLFLLLKYKPKIICNDNISINNNKTISYTKLVLYYLIIQIPLFLYLIIG